LIPPARLRRGKFGWGKNTFGASASGSMSDHYLNPVVPQNFTNAGTLGDFQSTTSAT